MTLPRIDDVKEKQAKFYADLKSKNIVLQEYSFDKIENKFNVVDTTLIDNLKKESEKNHRSFDEEYCFQCLQIFSKINNQRKGVNNVALEKIKSLYVTENRFALSLGHNNKVRFNESDISFAKDIDYIITKFWFRLNKGFGSNTSLPKTFDVLTRARLVISSHISSTLSEKYDELNKKIKNGSLTKEQAIELYDLYKKKPVLPENIDSTNIDDTFNFLNDDTFVENFLREKAKQEQKQQEAETENKSLKEQIAILEQREKERTEADEKQKIEQQEKEQKEKLEKESNDHAINEWYHAKKKHKANVRYMLFIFLLSLLPTSIGLFLNIYQPIKDYLNSINENYLLFIILVVLLLYVFELLGSRYIFDKEKIKHGWKYLIKRKTIEKEEIEKLKKDYIQNKGNK
jgi:antibiotic biosynthesis monooxygenase (ABM) superfamily enzyme